MSCPSHGFRVGDRVKVFAGSALGAYGEVIVSKPGAVDVQLDGMMLPVRFPNPEQYLDLIEREVRA